MGYDSRSLGAMHLSANTNFEPQRTNNFQAEFYDLPGMGTESLMLACQDFSLPQISNEVQEVKHGNASVKFAGVASHAGMSTMTLIDWITTDVEAIVDAWRQLVYNEQDDTIGWAARYKKRGSVTEFGPDGTFFRNWKVLGAWPNDVNYGSVSHESPDLKKIEMSITYDKAYRA